MRAKKWPSRCHGSTAGLEEGRDTRKAAAAAFGCRAGKLLPDAGGVGAMESGQAARIHRGGGVEDYRSSFDGSSRGPRVSWGGRRAGNGGSSVGKNEGLIWAFRLRGKIVLGRLTLQCRRRDRVPLQRTALFVCFFHFLYLNKYAQLDWNTL